MPYPAQPRRRVTVHSDEVARVDMSVDEDGDVELVTWFREGLKWECLEEAPTVVSARCLLGGLLELGLLGMTPSEALGPYEISTATARLFQLLRLAAQDVMAKVPATGYSAPPSP